MVEFSLKNKRFFIAFTLLILIQIIGITLWDNERIDSESVWTILPIFSVILFYVNMCKSENIGILKVRVIQYGIRICKGFEFKSFILLESILLSIMCVQLVVCEKVSDIRDIFAILFVYIIYILEIYAIANIVVTITTKYISAIIILLIFTVLSRENNIVKQQYWRQLCQWIGENDDYIKVNDVDRSIVVFILLALCIIVFNWITVHIKGIKGYI